jgi:hypothetical protein
MSQPAAALRERAFAAVIEGAGIDGLLANRSAIVLERIARGGGNTRWYVARNAADCRRLCGVFTPGSVVSFYFDDRIQDRALNDDVEAQILDLVVRCGDVVVCRHGADELELLVEFVAGPNELAEFTSEVRMGERVYFGAFPARDNDGVDAVTVTLPDADGVVRGHPH